MPVVGAVVHLLSGYGAADVPNLHNLGHIAHAEMVQHVRYRMSPSAAEGEKLCGGQVLVSKHEHSVGREGINARVPRVIIEAFG